MKFIRLLVSLTTIFAVWTSGSFAATGSITDLSVSGSASSVNFTAKFILEKDNTPSQSCVASSYTTSTGVAYPTSGPCSNQGIILAPYSGDGTDATHAVLSYKIDGIDKGDLREVIEANPNVHEIGQELQTSKSISLSGYSIGSTHTVEIVFTDIFGWQCDGSWSGCGNDNWFWQGEEGPIDSKTFTFHVTEDGPCIDVDGDGSWATSSYCEGSTDCNDSEPKITEAGSEVCFDGLDNDCDGDTDCKDEDCFSTCCPRGDCYLNVN